jgi:hypothetical protein
MCDPTWEVCDAPAEEPTDAILIEGEGQEVEEETAAASPMPLAFGVISLVAVVEAFVAKSSISTWFDDLAVEYGVTDGALKDKFAEGDPYAGWMTITLVQMVTSGSAFIMWLLNTVMGGNGGPIHGAFAMYSKIAVLFPIINIVATVLLGGVKDCAERKEGDGIIACS